MQFYCPTNSTCHDWIAHKPIRCKHMPMLKCGVTRHSQWPGQRHRNSGRFSCVIWAQGSKSAQAVSRAASTHHAASIGPLTHICVMPRAGHYAVVLWPYSFSLHVMGKGWWDIVVVLLLSLFVFVLSVSWNGHLNTTIEKLAEIGGGNREPGNRVEPRIICFNYYDILNSSCQRVFLNTIVK